MIKQEFLRVNYSELDDNEFESKLKTKVEEHILFLNEAYSKRGYFKTNLKSITPILKEGTTDFLLLNFDVVEMVFE